MFFFKDIIKFGEILLIASINKSLFVSLVIWETDKIKCNKVYESQMKVYLIKVYESKIKMYLIKVYESQIKIPAILT